MTLDLTSVFLFFIAFQYFFVSLTFFLFQTYIINVSRTILLAIKSQKNRALLEEEILQFSTDRRLFLFWPYPVIKKLKNELNKRK